MNCGHCRLFFIELHRRCTIRLNGECDCPICQGVCDCREPVVSLQVPAMSGSRLDAIRANDPNAGRKFGEKRK